MKEDSDGEELEHESGDSDKSTSSCEISDTDSEDSSEVDGDEFDRRRTEYLDQLSDLERQFSILKEQIYREKMTQLDVKLGEVRVGRAQEYIMPLDHLQENYRFRIEFASYLRKCKLATIHNGFEAEAQAANQNFMNEKLLALESLKEEINEKIRLLEEDRKNVDITADLWAYETSQNKRLTWQRGRLLEDNNNLVRRKPTVVSGPYVVYMLRDSDILEDWAAIKKAGNVFKRKSDWSYGLTRKKETYRPAYHKDSKYDKNSKYPKSLKYHKDSKYLKERKHHFTVKQGQKFKLW